MRLMVVSHCLTAGGAERFASNLICGLDPDEFEISLCLVRGEITYEVPAGVKVYDLGKRSAWTFPRSIYRMRCLLQRIAPDLVLTTIDATAVMTGLALRTLSERPSWIARFGGHPGEAPSLVKTALRRSVYSMVDRAVANSECLAAAILEHHAGFFDQVRTILNPVDFAAIDRLSKVSTPIPRDAIRPVIVSVGRLERAKRPDLMIEAFRMVRAKTPATLWICGDGPMKAELRRQVARLGLESSVQFPGFVDNPFSVLRMADLFILASDHEGLPNALIEAQGLGLPAVSTRCQCGPDEIIDDGKTGFLVEVGDVKGLASRLCALIADAELRARFSSAAKTQARKRFGYACHLGQWSTLLREVACARLCHVESLADPPESHGLR